MDGARADGNDGPGSDPEALAGEDGAIDPARARLLFGGLCAVYASVIALLYAFGLFGFFWKSVVVPSLLIVAYLAGRLRGFVRDWVVFLGAIALFDSCRGLIYGLTLKLDLPVHMDYAIALERALFGGALPSLWLQRALFADGKIGWLERSLVVVHASHFLMFLGFALLLWLVRPRAFVRFKLAMVFVMYLGIAIYALVPTVPPWMAANRFHVLAPIAQMTRKIYNLSVPSLAESFDINPIAAMPSLHSAFPLLLVLACFQQFGRRWGLLLSVYLAAVVFGIVYMGEHYVVDILAGFALALLAYLMAHRSEQVSRWLEQRRTSSPAPQASPAGWVALRGQLLLATLLLVLAQAAGSAAKAMQGREVPTEDFIARELDGKSPMARYYRALNAYYAHDYRRAQPLFAKARFEVPELAKQARAGLLLGESAYHNRDYQSAVAALGTQPKLSTEQGLMLAESRLQLGQREQGFQVLDFLARSLPDDRALQARKQQLEREFAR